MFGYKYYNGSFIKQKLYKTKDDEIKIIVKIYYKISLFSYKTIELPEQDISLKEYISAAKIIIDNYNKKYKIQDENRKHHM